MVAPIISASLSPNTERDDVIKAFWVLLSPWTWKYGEAVERVEEWFRDYFHVPVAVSFDSGRAAEFATLSSLGIGRGDEVMVQAFTCNVVANSVIWTGATAVYIDIDDTYNMDVRDMEKKRTQKTRAIIVQHTFGMPADIERIIAFARKYNLLIIEDCAHSLGATYKGKKVGSFGDAAFFSFGRDKVISSVWGGMAIIHASCQIFSAKTKLLEFQKKLPMPGFFWIAQQLIHPIAFFFIINTYTMLIGKALLVLMQVFHLLSFPVSKEEKRGIKPASVPAKYPNGLAELLVGQLEKLPRYTQQRRNIATYYNSELTSRGVPVAEHNEGNSYLRFPVLVKNPDEISKRAKTIGILLGNWYRNVIDPTGVDMRAVGYVLGSCPNAERKAGAIINLPTRITQAQARRVVELF